MVGLTAVWAGCGSSPTTIKVTVPTSPTPADGHTAALVSVLVTQGGQPVPDANAGQVEMTVTLGQFGPYTPGDNQDDPTQQNTTVPTALGTAGVNLYSTHPQPSTINFQYTDTNGVTANAVATVQFEAVPDAGS
jgi:hypothetical protein